MNTNIPTADSPPLDLACTFKPAFSQNLSERVLANREVDPVSLVEEYIGKANGWRFFTQIFKTGAPLVIGDITACVLCFWTGLGIASVLGFPMAAVHSYVFLVLLGTMVTTFLLMGLYNGGGMHPVYEFRQTILSTTLVYLLVTAVIGFSSTGLAVLVAYPMLLAAIPIVRAFLRSKLVKYNWWGVRCIIIDSKRRINNHYKLHQKNAFSGIRPVGFIQPDLPKNLNPDLRDEYLGTIDDVRNAISTTNAHCAIVHRCGRPDNEIFAYVARHLSSFSRIIIVHDDDRLPSLWSLGRNGGVCLEDRLLRPCSQCLKRTMDVTLSLLGMITLFPLFVIIAVWTKVTAPGPLFFGHERIGKHGRRFKAWKFRTMVVNSQAILEKTLAENPKMREEWEATYKLQNDPRITGPGHFLRKSSLDELPQLWNVLKGEMSLVGPRPIVVGEVDRYKTTFKNYLRVTPGVTGFWQISGRNLTTYDQRVEMDDYYVMNWSIWFDLYILVRTIKTVAFREGAF